MSFKKLDGGPAFPRGAAFAANSEDFDSGEVGMSLRDYFAGQVLAGIYSNAGALKAFESADSASAEIAEIVYRQADAMVKQREKDKTWVAEKEARP